MCQMPTPEMTSTKESSPKPNRATVSSSNPKKTDTNPSIRL